VDKSEGNSYGNERVCNCRVVYPVHIRARDRVVSDNYVNCLFLQKKKEDRRSLPSKAYSRTESSTKREWKMQEGAGTVSFT